MPEPESTWTLLFASYSEPHIRVFVVHGDPVAAGYDVLQRNPWMDDYSLVAAVEGTPRIRRRNENHSNEPCALYDD